MFINSSSWKKRGLEPSFSFSLPFDSVNFLIFAIDDGLDSVLFRMSRTSISSSVQPLMVSQSTVSHISLFYSLSDHSSFNEKLNLGSSEQNIKKRKKVIFSKYISHASSRKSDHFFKLTQERKVL